MEFTYDDYAAHVELLKASGYSIVPYDNKVKGFQAILRHDVDFDIKKAADFARFESEVCGVTSTYFILVSSRFYNVLSLDSKKYLDIILNNGHEIGLHFDETVCSEQDGIFQQVHRETAILSEVIGKKVRCVSMHRPSKRTLELNFSFEELINSYSKEYFEQWKYVSDSRMYWREDLTQLIQSRQHKRLHILTHPFWYSSQNETTRDKLMRFIKDAPVDRFEMIDENFRDLNEFVERKDITWS